jgi:hypothetical protein
MEGFAFISALDINKSYYHIKLDDDVDAQKLCTIIFPWNKRKQKSKHLPSLLGLVIMQDKSLYPFIRKSLIQLKSGI